MYNTYRARTWKISSGQCASQTAGTVSPIIRGRMEEAQERGLPRISAEGEAGRHTVLLYGGGGSLLESGRSSLTAGVISGMRMLLRPLRSVDGPPRPY